MRKGGRHLPPFLSGNTTRNETCHPGSVVQVISFPGRRMGDFIPSPQRADSRMRESDCSQI